MVTRDPWLDNAKMTLVALVVVGHGWALLPSDGLPGSLYSFLYLWHMPAFVLVTGYLSRGFTWTAARTWSLVRGVVVPYLLIETLLAAFRTDVGGERLEDLYLHPHWPLWYLVALVAWRLCAPVFRAMPAALAVLVAVAASLAVGFSDVVLLDLPRILGFLPFFVLGLVATPERLEVLRRPVVRRLAPPVLAGTLVVALTLGAWASRGWLYLNYSYAQLHASGFAAVGTRLALLAVGLVSAAAFLALVPRTEGWFTRMGSATLVVYLFHGFVVKSASYLGFGDWGAAHPDLAVLVVLVAGPVLAMTLASPPVARRLTDAVDPLGWVERRTTDTARLARAAEELPVEVPVSDGSERATVLAG